MIWATVSSWSCFCWLYRASPSLAAKNIINLVSVLTIWWCPCVYILRVLILLNRSLDFPILLLSSISLHWSLRKAFLSLLVTLWNSAFRCLYYSFSALLFTSLLFTAICKASPDSHFAFLHFFSMGMVLIPVSCTVSRTSVHSSSGTLSIRSRPSNLFLTSAVDMAGDRSKVWCSNEQYWIGTWNVRSLNQGKFSCKDGLNKGQKWYEPDRSRGY